MVSVREIKRLFSDIAPHRQLPSSAISEFQKRAENLLKQFVIKCDEEAGGIDSNTRLTDKHVKLAFVSMEDEVEIGEWNDEVE